MKRKIKKSQPIVFGLTGGIGSGKSLAAYFFRKHHIPVINLDEIGREISAHNASLAKQVSKICGERVHRGDTFDRARVREIVFNNPKKKKALEALFHPLIWKAYRQRLAVYSKQAKRLVICEAALLLENNHAESFDRLIVVLAPKRLRTRRIVKRDAGALLWLARIYRDQVSDGIRRKFADYVLNNNRSKKHLEERVASLVSEWKKEGYL